MHCEMQQEQLRTMKDETRQFIYGIWPPFSEIIIEIPRLFDGPLQ